MAERMMAGFGMPSKVEFFLTTQSDES